MIQGYLVSTDGKTHAVLALSVEVDPGHEMAVRSLPNDDIHTGVDLRRHRTRLALTLNRTDRPDRDEPCKRSPPREDEVTILDTRG